MLHTDDVGRVIGYINADTGPVMRAPSNPGIVFPGLIDFKNDTKIPGFSPFAPSLSNYFFFFLFTIRPNIKAPVSLIHTINNKYPICSGPPIFDICSM